MREKERDNYRRYNCNCLSMCVLWVLVLWVGKRERERDVSIKIHCTPFTLWTQLIDSSPVISCLLICCPCFRRLRSWSAPFFLILHPDILIFITSCCIARFNRAYFMWCPTVVHSVVASVKWCVNDSISWLPSFIQTYTLFSVITVTALWFTLGPFYLSCRHHMALACAIVFFTSNVFSLFLFLSKSNSRYGRLLQSINSHSNTKNQYNNKQKATFHLEVWVNCNLLQVSLMNVRVCVQTDLFSHFSCWGERERERVVTVTPLDYM